MQNGYFHETGRFAPETAVGTGAAEPIVDEYEAAKAVPSVDETTLDETGQKSQNEVHAGKTIAYSGEDIGDSGTGEVKSTGEDYEVRNESNDDVPLAGASVDTDDAEVNKLAEEVRPEVPQATKRSRKKADTV